MNYKVLKKIHFTEYKFHKKTPTRHKEKLIFLEFSYGKSLEDI